MVEFINIDNEIVSSKMPFLERKIRDNFGDKGVSLYSLLVDNRLIFVIMCAGRGLLIKNTGESIKFKRSMTGSLGEVEKDRMIIKPKNDYEDEEEFTCSVNTSIVDSAGNEVGICIFPSYNDGIYSNRVCFSQYNKEKDVACEINYDYSCEGDMIYPGLLNRVESAHIYKNVKKKGTSCRWGIVPSRIQIYSRSDIESDTLNYSFVSFNEHGILKTLVNGSYNLYNGSGYITRYCKLGFMNSKHQLVELPWPFGEYIKEEEIFSWIKENGFMVDIPDELIKVFNNQDEDVIFLQEFLKVIDAHKKDRKYIHL